MNYLDLGIVIVSWNVQELLRRCLQSIDESLRGSGITYRVVVVDNGSEDGTVAMLAEEFPDVCLVENRSNRGFARGSNDGLRTFGLLNSNAARLGKPRYVLLLNPDTEVIGDALARLALYLDAHSDVVAVGPQLRYGDGSLQSSRRRFPSIAMLFWESTLLERWWPTNPWACRYRLEDRPAVEEQTVDWLVGAAMMVRASAVDRAGPLDEGFFMYSEELEWQQRMTDSHRDQAAHITYIAGAVVTHHEGRSSEQNLLLRHINFNRSKLRYTRLRFGAGIATLLRVFLVVTYLLEATIEGGKWLAGHKRRLRAARVRQYARVAGNLTLSP